MILKDFEYIIARTIRKWIPDRFFHFLMSKEIGVKAGLETTAPEQALSQYLNVLTENSFSLKDKKCLIFGYGGNFGLGCLLLEQGATHVILADKYAHPDHGRNLTLLPRYAKYLEQQENTVVPRPEYITLHHADIQTLNFAVEIVLSSSVLEHVTDIENIIFSLSKLTDYQGIQIHFVDLRDHFFKYPFAMLCYSENTWRRWLNPSSHLNRLRMKDYQQFFNKYFTHVEITVLEKNIPAFEQVHSHIRAEFLTGRVENDAATQILIVAKK